MIKIPPHNIELEQNLLSILILHNNSISDVVDLIDSSDFYKTAHQEIYKSIIRLYKQKEPIDISIIGDDLKKRNKLDIVGAVYLSGIIDNMPGNIRANYYAEKIRGKATIRELINKTHCLLDKCYMDSEDPATILDDAQKEINSLEIGGKQNTFISMKNLTIESLDRYEEMNKGTQVGVFTGYKKLDSITGGFSGGKLIIVAARPGMGKTSMMRNCSANMAKKGTHVGIFSAEMDKEEIDDGYISQETGINSMRLNTGTGPNIYDWEKINDVAQYKSEWPIWIDDTGPIAINELKRRARILVKSGIKCIWIDQLSKIKGTKNQSAFDEASECTRECSHLAKELKIPIFLLAQLNRDVEKRSNKKPQLSDLKNTGQLEEDASVVLFLYREFYYTKKEEDINKAEIEIAKNRGGATYNIDMLWDGKRTTFYDIQE